MGEVQSVGVMHAMQSKIATLEAEISSLKTTVMNRHRGMGGATANVGVHWGNFTIPGNDLAFSNGARTFNNSDLFDTLNEPALRKMVDPPSQYNAEYMLEANKTLITALLTLNTKISNLEKLREMDLIIAQ